MSIFRKRTSVILALSFVFILSTAALGDTIRLKDGSILKGRIVSFANGKFTIALGEGSRSRQMTFTASEIDSIVFDSPAAGWTAETRTVDYKKPTGNPRVVITDENRPTDTRPATKPELKKPEPRTTSTATTANIAAKPITWNVKVLADNTSNGWTNTGWVLKKGQTIRISSGEAKISLGAGKTTDASGSPDIADSNKLLKNVPTGALVAVIGDDNNDFLYIGASREITATRDGALFLGINEGNLNDNSGSLDVKIEIIP